MAEFSIRSDAVDVEQIMRQIRARIREKRGADYTEQEIQQLANAKLETFLDPTRVRSDLLEQFRTHRRREPPVPSYEFSDSAAFETHRPLLRAVRKLLRPILKLFFNPTPFADALHVQAQINARNAEVLERVETLHYELIHNLVVEITRLGIEVKNLKMRVESVSGRLDFDERRARALEGVVQYRTGGLTPRPAPEDKGGADAEPRTAGALGERRRRRRRRGRRRHNGAPMTAGTANAEPGVRQADGGGGEPAATHSDSSES
jgi:hypothetical protein